MHIYIYTNIYIYIFVPFNDIYKYIRHVYICIYIVNTYTLHIYMYIYDCGIFSLAFTYVHLNINID